MTLIKLNNKITKCRQCDRLVNFREKIATEKRRQYIDQNYWGKPITGYGDSEAQLLMIGLARDLNVGDRLIASDHGLTSYELALFLRCRIFQKVHRECPLKWRSANYP